ncbi:MAG: tetratricopeptide repeat protein [Cyclobacteriaceae bacterium]
MLIFAFFNTTSQNLNLDSLKQIWHNVSLADSTRLNAIQKIAWDGYRSNNPDSAFYYAQLQYDFAEKVGSKIQMASALNTQGYIFNVKADYGTSLNYFARSLALAKEINNKEKIAVVSLNMGVVYDTQGDYIKAMKSYSSSLKLFEELNHERGIISALNNIAVIYQIQGDYVSAIEYYSRCLKSAEEIGAQDVLLTTLNNIGLVYQQHEEYDKALEQYNRSLKIAEEVDYKPGIGFILNNMGVINEKKGQNSQAIEYFNRSLKVREGIDDQQGIVSCLSNIGSIYKNMGNYEMALDFQTRSLKLAEVIGYKQGAASILNNIAVIFRIQNNPTRAINYSRRSLSVAREIGAVIEIKAAADNLHQAYQQIGDYKASLAMHELFIEMRDSIENIDAQKEVIRQEFKYNYEKQSIADSIAFANQQALVGLTYQTRLEKQRYAFFIGISLLLIFLGVYLRIRFIKSQAQLDALLQEIKLLKVQAKINLGSITPTEEAQLDKERIENALKASLNPSDWSILNTLYANPAIGNKEIADIVSLSVEGVRSSLKKMYRYFYIEKTANQRVLLVIQAAKLSNPSLTHPN